MSAVLRFQAGVFSFQVTEKRPKKQNKDWLSWLKVMMAFKLRQKTSRLGAPVIFWEHVRAGLPSFAFADPLRDAQLLSEARRWAKNIVGDDPNLEKKTNHALALMVKRLNLEGLSYTEAG